MRTALWLVALAAILLGAILFFTGGEKKATSQTAATVASSVSTAPIVPEPPRPPSTSTAGLLPLPVDNDGTNAGASPSATGDASAPLPFAEAMQSSDPFVRRAAIDAALSKRDLTALPRILQVDLTQNGYEAAAAIEAAGKLSALAPEPSKREGVRTLGKWLKQESGRTTNDAKGNVPIVVEALADTKSDEAIAPLVQALDSAQQPIQVETLIVESLDRLNARSAAASVERFVVRVKAKQPADQLERDLVEEALVTANAALGKWR